MTDAPDGTPERLAELRNHFQQWNQQALERLVNAVLYAYLAQRDRIEALERRVEELER